LLTFAGLVYRLAGSVKPRRWHALSSVPDSRIRAKD